MRVGVGDGVPHCAPVPLPSGAEPVHPGQPQHQPSSARPQLLLTAPGLHWPVHNVWLTVPVNFMSSSPWLRSEEPGQRGLVEQKGTGFVPPPSAGAVRSGSSPRCLPSVRWRGGKPSLEGKAVTGCSGGPAACGGCCSAGAGCWPPAARWVPRAAAGTAAARAGTTPAGRRAPTGLAATATRTARGRVTAARTTTLRAAAPVSVGWGGTSWTPCRGEPWGWGHQPGLLLVGTGVCCYLPAPYLER